MELNLQQIIEAIDGKILMENKNLFFNEVCTDTRKITDGNVFFALKGDNFNGNDYAETAIEKGATVVIIDEIKFDINNLKNKVNVILVDNVKKALGDLARYYRKKLDIKVVGVTGSTGKTSTKDLVAAFLSGKYKVFKTEGNFNNDIGLPLMILKLNSNYDVAVLEMGMNNFGEIDYLASIALPEIALITNAGVAHIEYLKTRENILKEKISISNYMNKDNVLIINCENDMLKTVKNWDKCRLETTGYEDTYDVFAENIVMDSHTTDFDAVISDGTRHRFSLNMVGKHNVLNALLGIRVCLDLNITFEEMEKGLDNFKATSMRLEFIKKDKFTIINDSYNANPDSMKAALDVLNNYKGKRKIAILGTMGELGDYASTGHTEVGTFAKEKCDILLTCGEYSKCYETGFGNKTIVCEDKTEIVSKLQNLITNEDVILIKASRSAKFEEIIKEINNIYK